MVLLRKLYLAIAVSLIAGCSSANKSVSTVVSQSPSSAAPESTQTFVHTSSEASDWINVATSEDGRFADIDSNSVRYSSSLATYRLRLRLSTSNKDGISMYGSEQLMDCGSGAYQEMRILGFDEQGSVVFDKRDGLNAPIQENKVGSVQEYIYNYICRENKSPTISDSQLQRAYEERIRQNQQFVSELTKLYSSQENPCDYSWQTDAVGQQCGDRAASERPGGR